jgi:hypothetical protein
MLEALHLTAGEVLTMKNHGHPKGSLPPPHTQQCAKAVRRCTPLPDRAAVSGCAQYG